MMAIPHGLRLVEISIRRDDVVKAGLDLRGANVSVTSTPGTAKAAELHDTRVDVNVVLSGLWISVLFVFAYVDIFGFFRADVLKAALDGKAGTTDFTVDQTWRRLQDQPDLSGVDHGLRVDPQPDGHRLAHRPSENQQNSQHRRQPDLRGFRRRQRHRRNLGLLHRRQCRRGAAPVGGRPSRLDVAPARHPREECRCPSRRPSRAFLLWR
jgi:hypothetical protein